MVYRVTAVRRPGFDGRNRSGRRFLVDVPTLLREDEITPEILADELLIVEEVTDEQLAAEATATEPAADASELVAEAARLAGELREAQEVITGLTAHNASLLATLDSVLPLNRATDEQLLAEAGARGLLTVAPAAESSADGAESPATGEGDAEPVQCTGTAKSSGQQCKATALPGSDRCSQHPHDVPTGEAPVAQDGA